MLQVLLLALSLAMSTWSGYNSFLAIRGVTWKPVETREFSGVTFSIVVPAKNESKVLPRLLDRLVNMEYDKSKYDITVVEDGSTDDTEEQCKNYEMKYTNLRCVSLSPSRVVNGKSRALNYALTVSNNEIIGIFDADSIPKLDVLSIVAPKFSDPRVAAVQGRLVPVNVRDSVTSRFASLEELLYEYSIAGRAKMGLFVPLEGTCSFIRRDVVTSTGGWNENGLTEDLDLSLKIYAMGLRIVYSPNALTWREVPAKFRILWKQRIRWYRGHLEVPIKLDGKVNKKLLDGLIIVLSPVFMIMSVVNYTLFLLYPFSLMYILAMSFVSSSTLLSFLISVAISRRHMIGSFFPIFSLLYLNFLIILNFYAISLELVHSKRTWVKTERSNSDMKV